ncbi:MAG: cobalamin-binding protein [Candidatus Rokubacteria bacterium]|nr:cobalamin-binding protein [Candidatus Rokubacteria bacterium]
MIRALAVAGLLLVASPGHGLGVRDMIGRDVALAGPPARIVSLVPSVTEIVFALGAEDRLVGVTDFCDYPPAARRKPHVGGMLAPSLEVIVSLRPDLVVATTEGSREETVSQLQRLGIPVYLVAAHRLADVWDVIARLGALTGREAAAGHLVAGLRARVRAVEQAVAAGSRPRVLYVLWPEPLIVPGRESLVTELIGIAGGRSISASEGTDYPRFALEAAVARAPEVILLANHSASTGGIDRERWRGLTSVPAIRAGRLHAVNGDLLHRYGPRIVDGLEQLARAIHPEAFR